MACHNITHGIILPFLVAHNMILLTINSSLDLIKYGKLSPPWKLLTTVLTHNEHSKG